MKDARTDIANNQKVIRLVDYLTRIASLRTKIIRSFDDYQNVLWIKDIPRQKGCFTQGWGRDENYDPEIWIEIQTRREPELPALPLQCKDWVDQSSIRNKADLPNLHQQITKSIKNPNWHEESDQPEYVTKVIVLENHPEIKRKWDQYIEEKWKPWTEEHNSWEKVHKVYSALFSIHQEQMRLGEEYELVLGLGLLTWQTPSGQRVKRHLIVADATMEFEARLGRFSVRHHIEGAKLRPELDMLDIEEQPARAEEAAKSSLTIAEDDPWAKDCVEGVLQAMVNSINSQGEYHNSLEAKSVNWTPKPIVEYAPALILRKRSAKGLTETLKRIRERIEKGEAIPLEFQDLAEIRLKNYSEINDDPEDLTSEFEGEIFFPKPSNDEQRRIVDKIKKTSGVLVQGPPGTGKSHTIANLICHLLATGQRTLITAKTPRALQVLENLVPDELRPLCINLLGSGIEERRSLESSVGGILRKNEDWNDNVANQERANLENRLRDIREERAKINRRLQEIRESETYSLTIAEGRYCGTAARVAEAVNRDKKAYEWFTDTVPSDKPCPISESDLLSVLSSLRYFTAEKRKELKLEWPKSLTSIERFTNIVQDEIKASVEEKNVTRGADERITELLSKSDPLTIEKIHKVFLDLQISQKNMMASPYKWMANAVREISGGNTSLWHELYRVTRDAITSIETTVTIADDKNIDYPDATIIRTLYNDTCKLRDHLKNGGKLGWGPFRPKDVKAYLYITKMVRIDGRPCETFDELSVLSDVLRVRIEFEKVWSFWAGRSDEIKGPYALQLTALKSMCDSLNDALSLETLISKCREAIRECPSITEPIWSDENQIESLIASCGLAQAHYRKRIVNSVIKNMEDSLLPIIAKTNSHPVTNEILQAINNRSINRYANAINKIETLTKEKHRLLKVEGYLTKLHQLLPNFTMALQQTNNESIWNSRIRNVCNAWYWAQAKNWIDEFIRQDDVPALTKRSKQIEDEINILIGKLASLHAWSFCFSRLKEQHRRHMEAWQQSMRRLGKGTGKHAPRHRREAQRHLNECREAVPAWVMPLHRVWDTVDPAPNIFDVIIVDEASQCGIEALPLFYLGNKILIVGDDKQISPDAVGLPRDAVHRLMEEFLYDFYFKSSFDVESSLFDQGKLRYGTRRITLREHFRCMPEIIRFSNNLCYSDTPLIPLRQYGPNRLQPLEHVYVTNGYREGANNRTINRPEADAIVEKVVELCSDKRYENKTIGMIALQGEAQANIIENMLLERLGAEEMERRRLVCGNPYSFQGDERDIIMLSLVAANNERIGPLTKAADERRFNVAASRARDMMILFHSITVNELSVSCIRRQLLEFFHNTEPQQIAGISQDEIEKRALQDNRSVVKPPPPFESWFELDVALELCRKGFTVLPQYEVAGKRIDLVIEGGHARLAIECDGDEWHGAENYEADMQRQRQLERCGWEFFRVRESAFYSNTESSLKGLWHSLEDRGIYPIKLAEQDEFKGNSSEGEDGALNDINEKTDFDGSSDIFGTENNHRKKRLEEVKLDEIHDAILQVLNKCPNQSCTVKSITGRVLKELGIITRGNPRLEFEKRVIQSLNFLLKMANIEKYKAKNVRIRLIQRKF